jgi:hypothetical protein
MAATDDDGVVLWPAQLPVLSLFVSISNRIYASPV